MKKCTLKALSLLGLFIFLGLQSSFAQTIFYAQTTTNLQTAANWNTARNGTGTAAVAGDFTAGNIFKIESSASIGGNWTVSGTNSKIIIGDSFAINTVVFSGAFTVTGTVDVLDLATFSVQATTSPFTIGTLATGSTVDYSADNNQSVKAGTYYNLTLSSATVARTKTASAGITVNGALSVTTNNTLAMSTFLLDGSLTSISGTGTITTANTSTLPIPASKTWTQTVSYTATTPGIAGGTYENLSLSGNGTKNAQGNITVNSTLTFTGTSAVILAMTSYTLSGITTNVGVGTITTTNTSANPLPSNKTWTETVTYSGAVAQTVVGGTYQILNINGGSSVVKTASGNISVPGTLTVAATTIFDLNYYDLTAVGTYTNTGTTRTQDTSATPIPAGKTIGGTFQYNGSSAQTVIDGTYAALDLTGGNRTLSSAANIKVSGTLTMGSGTITVTGSTIELTGGTTQSINLNSSGSTFNNFNISAGTTKTIFLGNLTVNGTLNVASGATLAMTTFQLGGTLSSITGTGTISTTNVSATPIPSGLTWTQTVTYSSASNQTVMPGTYANLSVTGAGTSTLVGGDITVTSTLTVTTGTFALGANVLLGVGTPASTGTITTDNTSATPLPAGKTWTQTVTYSALTSQTVVGGTYQILNINGGSSIVKTASGAISVPGTLTVAASTIFDLNYYDLTSVGTFTNTGTTRTQDSSATPIPSGKTIAGTFMYNGLSPQTVIDGTYTNLDLTGGNRTLSSAANIKVSGTLTMGSGAVTVTGSTVELNGATQTINLNASGSTFNNFTITAGTTKTIAGGDLTVNGTLNIASGATLAMTTFQLGGTLTSITGTGTITTTNTGSTPLSSGKTWTQTVTFAAVLAQTVPGGTYQILNINGGGSIVKTASGAIGVPGTLTVAATTIFDLSTFDLTSVGTYTNTGTTRTQDTSATPIPAGKTIAGTFMYNGSSAQTVIDGTYTNLDLTGGNRTLSTAANIKVSTTLTMGSGVLTATGSTVELNGAGAQTINLNASGSTFGNFTITAGTTKTIAGGDLNVTDTLNVNTGATLVMGTFQLGGTLSKITGTGTITTTNQGTTPLPSGKTWTQTVNYSAAANQTVRAGTYENLTISGAGSFVKSADGAITVNTTLNIANTTILDMLINKLQGITSVTSTSGTLRTADTTSTPLPAGKSWLVGSVLYNSVNPQTVVDGTYVLLNVAGGSRTFSSLGNISVSSTFTANTGGATYTTTGSTLVFTSAANQTITLLANFGFNNVSFTGGAIKTIGVACSVAGNMNIASGVTVNMGANALSGAALTTTGASTGLFRTQNTTASPIPTGRTWNFRVQFDVTNNNQSIPAGTYNGGLYMSATSGSRTRTLLGNVTVGDTLSVGSTFTTLVIGSNTLTINGIINSAQTGTITGSATSNLTIGSNANDAGTLLMTQTSNATKTLNNLTLSRASGNDALVIGNSTLVQGIVSITDGTLNGNGMLTFLSTSATTSAQLDQLTGTGDVSGNFIVQRFVQGRAIVSANRWRFLASSVNSVGTISADWQQQIPITGAGTGGTLCPSNTVNSNGFDATKPNNSSFYTFNKSTQGWVALANTNATSLATGKGYRVFVRGDRSAQGLCNLLATVPPTPNDVILSATGTLAKYSQSITCGVSPNDYEFVGNPFQATIDWESAGVTKTNIAATIYGFASSTSVDGAYGSWNGTAGTNGMSRYISPGMSFWVQTDGTGNGSISIAESAKNVAQTGAGLFKTSEEQEILRTKLYLDSSTDYVDEVVVAFRKGTSWNYSVKEDAAKLAFGTNQLALFTENEPAAIQAITMIPYTDETHKIIHINAKTVTNGNYKLGFDGMSTFDDFLTVTLTDSYLNKTQNIKENPDYTFTTPDDLSISPNRFYLTFSNYAATTGTHEVNASNASSIKLYPNPMKDEFVIELANSIEDKATIKVFDLLGKQMNPTIKAENNKWIINASDFKEGVYIVQFEQGGVTSQLKVVKN